MDANSVIIIGRPNSRLKLESSFGFRKFSNQTPTYNQQNYCDRIRKIKKRDPSSLASIKIKDALNSKILLGSIDIVFFFLSILCL